MEAAHSRSEYFGQLAAPEAEIPASNTSERASSGPDSEEPEGLGEEFVDLALDWYGNLPGHLAPVSRSRKSAP
ncbi:hypothetical protein DC366_12620 [Pelagivirga sediminicola]|uniref:Uncharacterized protein n=1 Tax=Pelagivirga sediminicola TaxID=2170575 RepID=A0A2T7G546_9RHOB|nr:hypothetical protein DC366_12620 [Pelagivirga sediminicola]